MMYISKLGRDYAVTLLSYPAGAMGRKTALRVFLCSDTSLAGQAIRILRSPLNY